MTRQFRGRGDSPNCFFVYGDDADKVRNSKRPEGFCDNNRKLICEMTTGKFAPCYVIVKCTIPPLLNMLKNVHDS